MKGILDVARGLGEKPDPLVHAREWKKRHGEKVIAYLLPDVPEEIIHAAGFLPLPIIGGDLKTSKSHHNLPQFTCSVIRRPLEMTVSGMLDFIDGMIIPYVCDSTRAFSHVWESIFPHLFSHTLWLPKKCEGESVRGFLLQEFLRFKERLEDLGGREITTPALKKSIAIYNLRRRLLKKLFDSVKNGQIQISYADFLGIVQTAMVMPEEEGNTILEGLVKESNDPPGVNHGNQRPRVFLLGTLCESNAILEGVDEVGLQVIGDNLYNGTRWFSQCVDETADPIKGLVDRHFSKDPLSAYHYSGNQLRTYLTKKMRDNTIDGIIYRVPKYCDPSEFDYPLLKGLLQEMGIPHLFVETDPFSDSESQIRTRLEAFAEILRDQE
jgi:benzoyl-CoA reductase subunit C